MMLKASAEQNVKMINLLRNIVTSIALYCIFANAVASNKLPTHNPVPGGIALVSIPHPHDPTTSKPKAYFQGRQVMVLAQHNNNATWVAVTGIPLKTISGEYTLNISFTAQEQQKIKFSVLDKTYREQHITINNKRQVNPNKLDLQRIGREKQEMIRAFQNWDDSAPAITQIFWPLKGEISSPFGLKRFYNGESRNPHSGLDIAAAEGVPIEAPADARITASGDFFFNGLTLMLDHGHGLVTMYCHLSRIDVALGGRVTAGQAIGLVGKTGRATGPHLHWSVSLNDARINPYLLMPPTFNSAQ